MLKRDTIRAKRRRRNIPATVVHAEARFIADAENLAEHPSCKRCGTYFDNRGCLRCERRVFLYGSDGMCENCSAVVRRCLANCLEQRLRSVGVMENFSHTLSDCVSSARAIIGRPRIRKDK